MDVAQAGTAFDAATVDMQRLRLGTEVSYEHTLSSGASLIPWGEVGLRHDGGDTASGVQQLWEHGATDPLLHSAPGARLDAEFGYGFAALRGQGLLTPYGGVSLVGEAARGYRFGGRLALGRSATVSLEAERRQHLAAARIHRLMLLGNVQF